MVLKRCMCHLLFIFRTIELYVQNSKGVDEWPTTSTMNTAVVIVLVSFFVGAKDALKTTETFSHAAADVLALHRGAKIAGFSDLNADKTTDLILTSIPGRYMMART